MTTFRLLLLAATLAGSIGAAASTAEARRGTAKTTPLTAGEIHALYGQKSWIWKAGAGYFSVRERRFTAWSKENGKPSYGVGRWFITEPGRLCFKADWHARDGSAPATTCFSHRKRATSSTRSASRTASGTYSSMGGRGRATNSPSCGAAIM